MRGLLVIRISFFVGKRLTGRCGEAWLLWPRRSRWSGASSQVTSRPPGWRRLCPPLPHRRHFPACGRPRSAHLSAPSGSLSPFPPPSAALLPPPQPTTRSHSPNLASAPAAAAAPALRRGGWRATTRTRSSCCSRRSGRLEPGDPIMRGPWQAPARPPAYLALSGSAVRPLGRSLSPSRATNHLAGGLPELQHPGQRPAPSARSLARLSQPTRRPLPSSSPGSGRRLLLARRLQSLLLLPSPLLPRCVLCAGRPGLPRRAGLARSGAAFPPSSLRRRDRPGGAPDPAPPSSAFSPQQPPVRSPPQGESPPQPKMEAPPPLPRARALRRQQSGSTSRGEAERREAGQGCLPSRGPVGAVNFHEAEASWGSSAQPASALSGSLESRLRGSRSRALCLGSRPRLPEPKEEVSLVDLEERLREHLRELSGSGRHPAHA